jgi:hypothetical protein
MSTDRASTRSSDSAAEEAPEKPKGDPAAVADPSTQGPDLVPADQPDGG